MYFLYLRAVFIILDDEWEDKWEMKSSCYFAIEWNKNCYIFKQ